MGIIVVTFYYYAPKEKYGIKTRIKAKEIYRFIEGYSFYQSGGTNYWSMWPNSKNNKSLREISFDNWVLSFDKYNKDNESRSELSRFKKIFFDYSGKSKWTLLLDVSDNTHDNIPILMTDDVDPSLLIELMTAISMLKTTHENPQLHHGLFIKKDLSAFFVHPHYFMSGSAKRHGNINLDTSEWPDTLSYLTPTGVVSITIHGKHQRQAPK